MSLDSFLAKFSRSFHVIAFSARSCSLALVDKFLDFVFKMEATDDDTGDDRDDQTGYDVDERDLPAEHRKQHCRRNFVDERRCDQEREGDAERYTGFNEPDEERDCRTGTERRGDTEEGGYDIAHPFVRPPTHFFTFCGVMYVRTMATPNTITASISVTLIES